MQILSTKKSFFVLVLIVMILIASILVTTALAPKQQVEATFVEFLSFAASGLGTVIPVVSAVAGTFELAGAIANGMAAQERAEANGEDGAAGFMKGMLGCDDSMHREVMSELYNISESITKMNGTVETINSKMDTVNSKLDNITSLITSLSDQVGAGVDTIVMQLNKNQMEMKDWINTYTKINNFYTKYNNVRGTLKNKMNDLDLSYASYDKFLKQVEGMENGPAYIAAIKKINLNYNESYAALTDEEKALIDTTISFDSENISIGNYLKQKVNYILNDVLNTLYTSFTSSYEVDMFDSLTNMGKYILGDGMAYEAGIGEIFYRLAIKTYSNSDEVHEAYRNFVANVLYDYMTTAYLCNMALTFKLNYSLANNPDEVDMRASYKNKLASIKDMTNRVMMYVDYEAKKCKLIYDMDGFVPASGRNMDDYLVYYANDKNKDLGNTSSLYVPKSNLNANNIVLNEKNVFININDTYKIKAYLSHENVSGQLEWYSTNTNVAIVKKGKVTAVGEGNCVVGITVNGENKPLATIVVSDAIGRQNLTTNDVYTFGDDAKKLTLPGNGMTYEYNIDAYVKPEIINVSKDDHMVELYEELKNNEQNPRAYEFTVNNQYYKVDANKLYIVKPTSGVVSARTTIANQNVAVQLIVNCADEVEDVMETQFNDTGGEYNPNVKYIYCLEDLLEWQENYKNQLLSNTKGYGEDVKLMVDIDYGYREWRMPELGLEETINGNERTYKSYTFNGNGHTISNITVGGDANGYAMFDKVAGDVVGLKINNVKFKTNKPTDNIDKCIYSILGREANDATVLTKKDEKGNDVIDRIFPHPTHVRDISISGDIYIEVNPLTNNIVYSPVLYTARSSASDECPKEASTHSRYIDTSHVLIDCKGRDVRVDIDYAPKGWVSNSVIMAGSLSVVNIKRNENVHIKYDNGASITPGYFANTTDVNGHTKTLDTLNRINVNTFNVKDYWTNIGFTEANYDMTDVYGQDAVPRYRERMYEMGGTGYEMRIAGEGIQTIYNIGEPIRLDNVKITLNGVDITKDTTNNVKSIDVDEAGEKLLVFTYNNGLGIKELAVTLYYDTLPELRLLEYFTNEGEVTKITDYFNSGIAFTLKGETFHRVGYKQVGWIDRDTEERFRLNERVVSYDNLHLYPIWEAQFVDVAINTYMEYPNGGYFKLNIDPKIEQRKADSMYVPSKDPINDRTCITEPVKVSPDGKGVIDLYYNLPRFNITFVYDETKSKLADGKYTKTLEYRKGQSINANPLGAKPLGNWKIDSFVEETIDGATADATYHVAYVPYDYTVIFEANGNEYKKLQGLSAGDKIEVENPSDVMDEVYVYKFAGWGEEYTGYVEGDTRYVARYNREYRPYKISIPSNVIVNKIGSEPLKDGDTLHIGDIVNIKYKSTEGKELVSMDIQGATRVSVDAYHVKGELVVTCEEKDVAPVTPVEPETGGDEQVDVDVDDPDDIVEVKVDGKAIDASYYTIDGGKVIINKEYLDSLTKGNHELVVTTSKGETKTLFDIAGEDETADDKPTATTPAWVIAVSTVGAVLGVAIIVGVVFVVLKKRKSTIK